MRDLAKQIISDIEDLTGLEIRDENSIIVEDYIAVKLNQEFLKRYNNKINLYKRETQNLTDFINSTIMGTPGENAEDNIEIY